MTPSFILVVPTLNAGSSWSEWISAVQNQSAKPLDVLVLDSESDDFTLTRSTQAGFKVKHILRKNFNHGGTRQIAVDLFRDQTEILVFMTQDAFLADSDSLLNLLAAFDNKNVGAAYGRQLAKKNATPFASHSRIFNYDKNSRTTSLSDKATLGFKACFLSNSFAAYRVSDLLSVGGFPKNIILGEDAFVAAKLLIAGKSVRYQAHACVFHSHNYTAFDEFRRHFDIGVFHSRERWLMENFGGASGEGLRFVLSELRYLLRMAPWLIPSALLRTACKLAGYRLGQAESCLPVGLKRHLSMFKAFWG